MEFLLQFLPIIIYILLIIIIVVGIILGIKLIFTIDKVEKILDGVNEKIAKVTPIFDTFEMVSDKLSGFFASIVSGVENLITKLFMNNKKKEKIEEDDYE